MSIRDLTRREPDSDGSIEHSDPMLELSDEDILDAMRRIPGYLDISIGDFRTIYHLAHHHAVERLFGRVRAARLMRTGIEPLRPDVKLDAAARVLARQGVKGLPVVNGDEVVVGMLTENDFLLHLNADTFLDLLLRLLESSGEFTNHCHQSTVQEVMSTPAVTVTAEAGFQEIIHTFHALQGRGIPVVDDAGRLRGLLLRKDFLATHRLEELL